MLKFVRSKVRGDSVPKYSSNSLPRTKKKYGCSCSNEDKSKAQTNKQLPSLRSLSAQILSTTVRRRKLRQIMANHTSQQPTSVPVQCLAEFTAESEREIDCGKLQHVRALHASGEWLYVQNEKGDKGYVPLDYCAVDLSERIPPKPAPRVRNRRIRKSKVDERSQQNPDNEVTNKTIENSPGDTTKFVRSGSKLLSALDKDVDVYWSFNMLDHNISERWSQYHTSPSAASETPNPPSDVTTVISPEASSVEGDSLLSIEGSDVVLGEEAQHCSSSQLCLRRSRSIPNLSLSDPPIPGGKRLPSDSGISHDDVEVRLLDIPPDLKQPMRENDDSDYESYSSLNEDSSRSGLAKQRSVRFSIERDKKSIETHTTTTCKSTYGYLQNQKEVHQPTKNDLQHDGATSHAKCGTVKASQSSASAHPVSLLQPGMCDYNVGTKSPILQMNPPPYELAISRLHETKLASKSCSLKPTEMYPKADEMYSTNTVSTNCRPITKYVRSSANKPPYDVNSRFEQTCHAPTTQTLHCLRKTNSNSNHTDDCKPRFVIVTQDYVSREEGELTVRQGLVLKLRNTFGAQWCFVCSFGGHKGFVPARCLSPYHGPDSVV